MQYSTPLSVAVYPSSSPAVLRLTARRILTRVYLGRFAVSAAIFVAAVLSWQRTSRANTLMASLAFVAVLVFTAASALYTDVRRGPVSDWLVYSQVLFDVMLVTVVTHVTWDGTSSQFAPLYILVIAVAALLLPARSVLLVAALGIAMYVAEAVAVRNLVVDPPLVYQLVVFASVALGCGVIAMKLRDQTVGQDALAEELTRFRLRQNDVERVHLRAERLEAVAEPSASMAREIKNPLASIRSAVEQLAASPRATDDERTLATLIQRESDRLSRLLAGFLDFARVDVPRMRQLDISAVARNAGELVRSHPDTPAGVRIEYEFPRMPLTVSGDEDMLHGAFFNLVLNAVQASPPDGVIRIQATTLQAHQLSSDVTGFEHGAIAVQVIDQGHGIPEEIRQRLFDPFFTTKRGGSGLGLAVVHRSVEMHSGVVVVDSNTDGTARGSRFTLLFPRP